MEKLLKILAQNTVTARKTKNWSQEDLANKVGVRQSQISRLEKGDHMISLELFVRLAEALGIPLNELLKPPGASTAIDEKVVVAALRLPPEDKELLVFLIDALHRKNKRY